MTRAVKGNGWWQIIDPPRLEWKEHTPDFWTHADARTNSITFYPDGFTLFMPYLALAAISRETRAQYGTDIIRCNCDSRNPCADCRHKDTLWHFATYGDTSRITY